MKTELILRFSFEASHSLADYETPHPHIWKLETAISGDPIDGWIVDLVKVRSSFQEAVDSISDVYLNDCPIVDAMVRKYPTCETLSQYFLANLEKRLSEFKSTNPTIKLSSVCVALCSMENHELGAVRLTVGL